MLKLYDTGIYLVNGETIVTDPAALPALTGAAVSREEASRGTMAYGILKAHNTVDDMEQLKLKFDSMTSHDITYVGIIQTARASGMKEFPLPYVLTNCHNSLCAVGGTINEDDHKFALSAAHKYGGIYVPTNLGRRPQVCALGCPQVRRHLRAHKPRQHPLSQPGADGGLRQDDPGLRLAHPLRRAGQHGRG